jgi:ParB/RepB/Spo0J family partition protein
MNVTVVADHETGTAKFEDVPVADIFYEADRKYGGNGDVGKLAQSMRKVGLIQPVVLRPEAAGRYRIVAGRRRFEAAKALGWDRITARVLGLAGGNDEEVSLVENVNREDMSPLDEAELFQRQLAGGRDIAELAQHYNRSASAIYQRIRLTGLSDTLKDFFRKGTIGITAAAMLASLARDLQDQFAGKFGGFDTISAHQVENFIHSVQHNRLIGIVDGKCACCAHRTNYTDKDLFPELRDLQDVCFDDACYGKKWTALLEGLIKKERKKYPDDETRDILVLNGIPQFYNGTALTIGKTEYRIKKFSWNDKAYGAGQECFYAWGVNLAGNGKVAVTREKYRDRQKEAKTGEEKPVSKFGTDAVVKEAAAAGGITGGGAGEEIKKIDKLLGGAYGDADGYRQKLERELLKKILRRNREEHRDVSLLYLKFRIEEMYEGLEEDIFEVITGQKYTEGLADADPISTDKIIEALFAQDLLQSYEFPAADAEDDDDIVLQFAGMNSAEYRKLHHETARELINRALIGAGNEDPGAEDGEDGEA